MSIDSAYELLFTIGLSAIGICLFFVVLKSIIGPRISDRLMTVNMVGTLVTACIAILSVFLSGESYLADVCLIYVLISFVSVVVFTAVFINEYLRHKSVNRKEKK